VIEVSLLGSPRVERDGATVAFDTRKALALLAHLALTDAPRPRDALADLLWPDTGLERARGALRRTLSTLRRAIGAERVEATRDHVRLRKGAGLSIDVDRFRELRAAGDLDAAAAEFSGDLLEGFVVRDAPDFEAWVDGESETLRRELMATLASLAEAHESTGDLAAAGVTLRRWVTLDPLHEPAHQALIRVLAASGDRAAALAQYRACVLTLSQELGVPPLTATTELYEAVTRGSIAPVAPRPAPTLTHPAASAPALVGRDDDLARLVGAYRSIDTDGRVALIEGEAGIGKSRLASELLNLVWGEGTVVLTGRGYEDESGLAYGPVVEMLRDRLREDDAWLDNVDESALTELARLLPELVSARGVAPPGPFDQPGAESRFLAAVWDVLTAASAGPAPGLLVLDDAQWTDEATLRMFAYGIRRLAGRRLLVLVAWRTPHDHPVRRAALAAAQTEDAGHVLLDRLGEDAVGEMIRSVRSTRVDPSVVRRLWETTEGLPLLLVESLRAADDDAALRGGARELTRARLDPVSEQARQILAAAAVLGRRFAVEEVRAVSGRSEEETVAAVEELLADGLVRQHTNGYDFDHELVRTIVYEQTSLARRRLLHGRAADVVDAPPAAVGRHLRLAGREVEAADSYVEAGGRAREVFANEESLDHLRTALSLGHADRTRIRASIADLETVLGDYAGALVTLETAAAECATVELADVEHRLGRLQHRRGEYSLAEAHLLAALDATVDPDDVARARVTADLSLAAHSLGDDDRAQSLAQDAVKLAQQAEEPRALSQAYNLLGLLASTEGDTDEALTQLHRSRVLAEELDDGDLRIAALNNLALVHRARGELADALELTQLALDLCSTLGDRHREAALHNNLADLLHASGRAAEAMEHLKTAVRIFADVGVEEQPRPEIWKLVRW